MLVSFSVSNYKSIKDPVNLQLSPGKSRTKSEHISADDCLMMTSIFGSNSFGKSNIINAIRMLKGLVTDQTFTTNGPVFNWASKNDITSFKIIFNYNNNQFEYNLSVMPSHNSPKKTNVAPGLGDSPTGYKIVEESLFVISNINKIPEKCDLDNNKKTIFINCPDNMTDDDASMIAGIKEDIDDHKNQLRKITRELDYVTRRRERDNSSMVEMENKIKSMILENLNSDERPDDSEIDLIFHDIVSYHQYGGYSINEGPEYFRTKYPRINCVKDIDHFAVICLEHRELLCSSASLNKRYNSLVNLVEDIKLKIAALQGELPKKVSQSRHSLPILLSKQKYDGITDLNADEFKESVNDAYAWFASSLVIIGTADFHISTNSIGYMDRLSEITSSLDMGIERLEWVELMDNNKLWYEINTADRERLRGLMDYSLKNFCETATIISTNSGLYRFKYWCGEESIREIRVWHTHNTGFGFPLSMESDGTRRVIELASMLLPTQNEKTYIIDEIDRRLHPLMTNRLIKLFVDMNPGNKQLIFATHEMRLLTTDIFRKDEIWFITKKDGKSELTPLDEIKTFDKRIEKMYMEGRLPGAPDLSELNIE